MHGLHVGPVQEACRIHHRIDVAEPAGPLGRDQIAGEIARDDVDAGKGAREFLRPAHRTNRQMTAGQQFRHDMTADEAGGAEDQDAQGSTFR